MSIWRIWRIVETSTEFVPYCRRVLVTFQMLRLSLIDTLTSPTVFSVKNKNNFSKKQYKLKKFHFLLIIHKNLMQGHYFTRKFQASDVVKKSAAVSSRYSYLSTFRKSFEKKLKTKFLRPENFIYRRKILNLTRKTGLLRRMIKYISSISIKFCIVIKVFSYKHHQTF